MATAAYMQGRKKYGRPQAMLWADNPGTAINVNNQILYVPTGNEINSTDGLATGGSFLILSDDTREPINFKPTRIEQRERMINGRMRSYHIADKLTIDTSWENLPSRSYSKLARFDANGKPVLRTSGDRIPGDDETSELLNNAWTTRPTQEYTTDGGAGGVQMLDWYNRHQGTFWVYLSYDKYNSFGLGDSAFDNLPAYSHVIEVYFADFSYTVQQRGGSYDFWQISVSLEEV